MFSWPLGSCHLVFLETHGVIVCLFLNFPLRSARRLSARLCGPVRVDVGAKTDPEDPMAIGYVNGCDLYSTGSSFIGRCVGGAIRYVRQVTRAIAQGDTIGREVEDNAKAGPTRVGRAHPYIAS